MKSVDKRTSAMFCHLGFLVSFTKSVSINQEVYHPGKKKMTLLLQTPSRCCTFSPQSSRAYLYPIMVGKILNLPAFSFVRNAYAVAIFCDWSVAW